MKKLEMAANDLLRRDGKRALKRAGIRLDLRDELVEIPPTNDEEAECARELYELERVTPALRWRAPR